MSAFTTEKQESLNRISYDKIHNNVKQNILHSIPSYNHTLAMMDLDLVMMNLKVQLYRNKIEETSIASFELLFEQLFNSTMFHGFTHTICHDYFIPTITSPIFLHSNNIFLNFLSLPFVYCSSMHIFAKIQGCLKTRHLSSLLQEAEQKKSDYITLMEKKVDEILSSETLKSLYLFCNKLHTLSLIESSDHYIEKLGFIDQINQLRGSIINAVSGSTEHEMDTVLSICELPTLPIVNLGGTEESAEDII